MSKAVVFFADGTEECEALLVVDQMCIRDSTGPVRQPADRHHHQNAGPADRAGGAGRSGRLCLGHERSGHGLRHRLGTALPVSYTHLMRISSAPAGAE